MRICSLSGKLASENCPDTVKEYVSLSGKTEEKCDWHSQSGTTYPAEYATWFRLKNRSGIVGDRGTPLKILSPRSGSVFYYDESIPQNQQKLVIEASGGNGETARFFVDGKMLGKTERPFVQQVPLIRGRHRIEVECGKEDAKIEINVK